MFAELLLNMPIKLPKGTIRRHMIGNSISESIFLPEGATIAKRREAAIMWLVKQDGEICIHSVMNEFGWKVSTARLWLHRLRDEGKLVSGEVSKCTELVWYRLP